MLQMYPECEVMSVFVTTWRVIISLCCTHCQNITSNLLQSRC